MPDYPSYKSKDFVIWGSNLVLNKEESWKKINKRMRTAVRKAQSYKPEIKKVEGNKKNIKLFYPFCPSRHDLPEDRLDDNQKMYFAYLEKELVGGIIVTEMGDHLFLHYLGVTEKGRENQISSLLIWNIVELFSKSDFKYLDIGASYKTSLQNYFKGWATESYPVIMRAPKEEFQPKIMITPFENRFLGLRRNESFNVDEYFEKRFKKEYTFFPQGRWAIYSIFKWFKITNQIKEGEEVCIKTTTESPYISRHVTEPIEASCSISREINDKTKAVFVIHEFGFLHPEIEKLKKVCDDKNIILIEDCAYAFSSSSAGEYGDYLIYSFPKMFPLQFGGLLIGKKFEFEYIWDNFACADVKKEEICKDYLSNFIPKLDEICKKRRENYLYYQNIFGKDKTYFKLSENITPGAFILKVDNEERMKEISEFVRSFGIECGNYWKNSAIFFPVHQELKKSHLDYIAGSIKAMYRGGCGL